MLRHWAFLAIQYWRCHRWSLALLTLGLGLVLGLPGMMLALTDAFEAALERRGKEIPIVIGREGSPTDLVLQSVYYRAGESRAFPWKVWQELPRDCREWVVPVYLSGSARGWPVIGTSLEFFQHRNLALVQGAAPLQVGDCLLGARVAREAKLDTGMQFHSDPSRLFDPRGNTTYPLRVSGVLAASHGPEDDAVFVDLKTAWILAGLGHGHQAVESASREGEGKPEPMTLNMAVPEVQTLGTNVFQDFHFHGDMAEMPLSALLAWPPDERAGILLLGSMDGSTDGVAGFRTSEILRDLTQRLVRLRGFVLALGSLTLAVTVLLVFLVLTLNWRLRAREFQVLSYMGAGRSWMAGLMAVETSLVLVMASLLALAMVGLAWVGSDDFLLTWLDHSI